MNLKKAPNSTHKTKRIGRGQGSGMGKTATKGGKGQTARKGYNEKRGFEGGQQPLQRRLPKVGFSSKITKPYAINVEKIRGIKDLAEINFESLKHVHKFAKSVSKKKLIGKGAKELASKIKDERISTSGQEKNSISNKTAKAQKAEKAEKVAKAENSSQKSAKSAKNSADEKAASVKAEKVGEKSANSASEKAENSVKPTSSKAQNSTKAEKASSKTASKAENSAKNSATKASGEKASKKATSSASKTKCTKKESEAI